MVEARPFVQLRDGDGRQGEVPHRPPSHKQRSLISPSDSISMDTARADDLQVHRHQLSGIRIGSSHLESRG
jgi:hypothetical protein